MVAPGYGKRKGAGFERKVCVALSRWVTKGKRKDVFWRTALSGGRATINRRGTIRQDGDVCAVGPEGHVFTDKYLIECKFLKDLELQSFLTSGVGKLATVWRKLDTQSKRAGKRPMLIAKQNRVPPLVILRADDVLGSAALLRSYLWKLEVSTLQGVLRTPYTAEDFAGT